MVLYFRGKISKHIDVKITEEKEINSDFIIVFLSQFKEDDSIGT